MKSLAVASSDTDLGKTVVSAALLALAKKIIGKSIVMKPIQTGSELHSGRRVSPDLAEIEKLCRFEIPREIYHYCAPYLFLTPCSPHLAARKEISEISMDQIQKCLVELHMRFRLTIVETAGGILSPITDTLTNADLIAHLGIPAVFAVNNRLGAISGTAAAVQAAQNRGIEVKGIVLIDPAFSSQGVEEDILADNLETICRFTGVENGIRIPRVENIREDFEILTALLEPFAQKLFAEAGRGDNHH